MSSEDLLSSDKCLSTEDEVNELHTNLLVKLNSLQCILPNTEAFIDEIFSSVEAGATTLSQEGFFNCFVKRFLNKYYKSIYFL